MLLPDLETKRRPWKRILVVCLLLGMVAVGVIYAPGWYQQGRARRSRAMALAAEQKLAQNDLAGALESAQAALNLDRGNIAALRVLARGYTAMQREEAFELWEAVWQGKLPPAGERAQVIDLALALRRVDKAESFLQQALKQEPTPPEALRQAAVFFELRGQYVRSVQAARKYLASRPADEEIRLLVARQLLAGQDPQNVAEARQMLLSLGPSTNNAVAFAAIVLLARAPNLTPAELQACMGRLRSLPADLGRDLLLRDLELRATPARRDDLIAETIAKYQGGGDAQLLALGRWLNNRREFPRTLEVVPLAKAVTTQDLYLVHCDALAGLLRWTDLARLLEQEKPPLPEWLAELYRARAARELKNENQAAAHWDQALALAASIPKALVHLGEYAEQIGELTEAAKAYQRLTRFDPFTRQAFMGLVRVQEKKGDTAALMRVMREMVKAYPKDSAPQNDLAYLELLMEANVEGARQVAEQLVARNPELLAYRTTLALAHLRRKDLPAARAAYEKATIVWDEALPGWQAVYVAVIGGLGQADLAKKLAPTIPQSRLKPEERELIKPWL